MQNAKDVVKPLNQNKMKQFLLYTLSWISQNLAVPFWVVGHVHLSINVYEDIYEILVSFGMNAIVLAGFIYDYLKQIKKL